MTHFDPTLELEPSGPPDPRAGRRFLPMTADRKNERKQFRRDTNPPPTKGDNVVGSGCLLIVACFLATVGFVARGLWVLLP